MAAAPAPAPGPIGRSRRGRWWAAAAVALAAAAWAGSARAQSDWENQHGDTPGGSPDDSADGSGGSEDDGPTRQPPRPGDETVDPSGGSDIGTASSSGGVAGTLVLTAIPDAQLATARIGQARDHLTWSAAVTGVLNTGAGASVVPSLDALAGVTRVEASATYLYWEPRADLAAQTDACAAFEVAEHVCDPAHPSAAAVRDELLAARRQVCEAHRVCDRDALPTAAARADWDAATSSALAAARGALCAAQREALAASAPACTRADLVRARDWAAVRQWDRTKDPGVKAQICRQLALSRFECAEPAVEEVEAEALRRGIAEAHQAVCERHVPCAEAALTEDGERELAAQYGRICAADRADITTHPRRRVVSCSRGRIARRASALAARARLDPAWRPDAARYRALLSRFDDAVSYGPAVAVGARVKAARQTLVFADPVTLADEAQTVNLGAASLSVAAIGAGWGSVIWTYEFQQSYAVGAPVQLCAETSVEGVSQCRETSIGVPERRRAHIARLELRRFVTPSFGFAVRGSYDMSGDVFGVEVPLYFLRDRRGGLAGGVSVGYRSDRDEPLVGIFISETLSLLPR